MYLNSVKSELLDPQSRNQFHSHLQSDEQEAIQELIKLQNDRKIVIKAGIIILNFCDYRDSCLNHLNSKQKQPEGSYKSYYSEVDENDQKEAKIKIKRTLQTDLDLEINTKQEYDAMDPTDNKTKSL